jgi:hypothetical protein
MRGGLLLARCAPGVGAPPRDARLACVQVNRQRRRPRERAQAPSWPAIPESLARVRQGKVSGVQARA